MSAAPEDDFFGKRMPLGEHLEELRRHLWRALLGFAAACVLGLLLGQPVLDVITAPVDRELAAFHKRRLEANAGRLAAGDPRLTEANQPRAVLVEVQRRSLHAALGLPGPAQPEEWAPLEARIRPVHWALALGPAQVQRRPLTALTVTEPFLVYFKLSLFCGLVLGSPWIFYQLWSFVAAGLYPHEKRLVHLLLPASVGLFLAGVALCQLVVLPAGVAYLLGYHDWLGVEPDLRLSDWLNFALVMPLLFGGCFQTPLLMLALARLGLADAALFRRQRRLALFGLTVAAAVLSPTPDAINLLLLAGPLAALYEAGVLLCRLLPARPAPDDLEAPGATQTLSQ
jgi:sec-independent protein translocase protein TatC